MSHTQTMKFEAETRQLLDLMVHSLYSNKEVFLRELISNASDALDRLRLEAATDQALAAEQSDPEIRLEPNAESRTLTIRDNGIGMSREELISNIGTIARSGTQELIDRMRQAKPEEMSAELIGQFGVGFYSCFMIADRVELLTRRAGEEKASRWEYAGESGEYTISDGGRAPVGTSITLHLKDADADDGIEDYTDATVLRRIVKKYSDFVRYPVKLPVRREEQVDGLPVISLEDEVLNSMKAIWLRPADEVEDDEYNEFYRHISHGWDEPIERISMKAEGRFEYQALLFIPSQAPIDLYSQAYRRGLQLYVRNVKIMEHCEGLLPDYLRFVKGVVDAQDLPLNVSREMLQENRQVTQIRKALTKKIIDTLLAAKEAGEHYDEIWRSYGALIKEGIASHQESRDKLVPLLLFESTADPEAKVDLATYVERMPEGQEEIYYISGERRAAVESSPHLEAFSRRGFEVLFMLDSVDEFMLHHLQDFEGKTLRSVAQGEVDLGEEKEKEQKEERQKEFAPFLEALTEALKDHVKEVRLTTRLTTSPACLVGAEGELSPHIARLMRQNRMDIPEIKRDMELNPTHDVVVRLKQHFDDGDRGETLTDSAELLLGQALLAENAPLPDPARFAKLLTRLLAKVL